MLFDAAYAQELINGGDTRLHYHLEDRVPNHQTLEALQALELPQLVTATYVMLPGDDYVLADSTGGAISVTLPAHADGRIFTIIRTAGANNVTILPPAGETINGAASKVISASFTPFRVKYFGASSFLEV